MRETRHVSRLAFAAALAGMAAAAPSHAISIVEAKASLQVIGQDGNVLDELADTGRLLHGGERTESTVAVEHGDAAASHLTTFEARPILDYSANVIDPTGGGFAYIDDINWWSKQSAHLRVDASDRRAVASANVARTRANETHAIYAIALGSASGFATDPGPSVGGGNGFRLTISAWFVGGDFPETVGPTGGAPSFFIGDGFADTYGEPPGPTFIETIALINQGVFLSVDLDAAGVAVGEEYWFHELFQLGTGPGVDLEPLDVAFVDIDPVVGFVAVAPEPTTVALLGLGMGWLALGRARRRRDAPAGIL